MRNNLEIGKNELPPVGKIYAEMRFAQNRVLAICRALGVDTSPGFKDSAAAVSNKKLEGYNAFRSAHRKLRQYILKCDRDNLTSENIKEMTRLHEMAQNHADRVEKFAQEAGLDTDVLLSHIDEDTKTPASSLDDEVIDVPEVATEQEITFQTGEATEATARALEELEKQNEQVRGGGGGSTTISFGDNANIKSFVGGSVSGSEINVSEEVVVPEKVVPQEVSPEPLVLTDDMKTDSKDTSEDIPVKVPPEAVKTEGGEPKVKEEEKEEKIPDALLEKKRVETIASMEGNKNALLAKLSSSESGFDKSQRKQIESVVTKMFDETLQVVNSGKSAETDEATEKWHAFFQEKGWLLKNHYVALREAKEAGKTVMSNHELSNAFAFPDTIPGIFMTGVKAEKIKTESGFTLEEVDGKEVMKMNEGSELTNYEKSLSDWKKTKDHLSNMTKGFTDADGTFVPGYMSDENQAELKTVAQELENLGGLGRLFSGKKRGKYGELKLEKVALETREEAYREAKEAYFKTLHSVLNQRKARGGKKSTEKGFDDYRATIGAHFFAKQGDAGFREDVAGRDMRSFHEKEQSFNEEILPVERMALYGKTRDAWNNMSAGKKALVAGGIAAGAVAINGLNPTRMLTSMIAGTLTRKVLNMGILSDDQFKERFAKKVDEQRGKYDAVRIAAASNISPDSFRRMEESLNTEYTAIDAVEKSNKNKMTAISAGKTAVAAGVGVAFGSQVENDVIGDAVKGLLNGDAVSPVESASLGVDTGVPLTEAELPPTEMAIDHSGEPGFRSSGEVVPLGVDTGIPLAEAQLPPTPEVTIDHSGEPGFRPSGEVASTPPEAVIVNSESAVAAPSVESVLETQTFTESVPAPEQYVVVPEEFGGTDTLSETMLETFKAGNIEGLPDDMSRTEFLNKMYGSLEALKNNPRILELMSVTGHPPLESLELVYKDAVYDIQPLIDHMNGMPLDQIESGVRESVVTESSPVGGFDVPAQGAGSVLEGLDIPEVAEPSVVPEVASSFETTVLDTPTPEATIDHSGEPGFRPSGEVAPETLENAVNSVLTGVATAGTAAVENTEQPIESVLQGVTEEVPGSPVLNDELVMQSKFDSLGIDASQTDSVKAEAESRYTDAMNPDEQMNLIENIARREMLTSRLDGIAGVSADNGMKMLFDMKSSELVDALNQGTLESVLEARGVANPSFFAPIMTEFQRVGLLDGNESFSSVLEKALETKQIDTTPNKSLLGQDTLKIGTRGMFGNAKTINL